MSGNEYYDNLTFSYRVGENHENQPALFMWGIDCMDASCGFNLTLLFKEGFEMPTTKDEQNG